MFYGSLVGLFSTLILAPATWGRPSRALRYLPWSLTVALAIGAILDWTHASYFSYYLPSGMNVRLLKAALWLSLAALIFFYTALLHTLHARPYGRRSIVGLTLLAMASVYAMVERREAFQPLSRPQPRESSVRISQRPTLVVVGIDQASLDAILPLAEQGQLPFFSGLIRDGSYGRLETFRPPRSGPQWTTLMAGKLPYKHGILDDRIYSGQVVAPGAQLRLIPAWVGFPWWGTLGRGSSRVTADLRRSDALWEILPRLGVPSGVVGWPVSYPADEGPLFAFSDRFFDGETDENSALPPEVAQRGALFRIAPDELDPALLESFGEAPYDPVTAALAEDLWRHSIASISLEQEAELRALFVHLPGLAEVSESSFGGFSAVQFDGVQGQRYLAAHQRTIAYYSQLDRMLRELWERVRAPRLLAVVSPYGVEPAGGLERIVNALLRRAVVEGTSRKAPDGTLMLLGDGVAAGTFLSGVRPIDLVPTLLYGLGFPLARELDGKVITSAFEQSFLASHPLVFVPSYTAVVPIAEAPPAAAEPAADGGAQAEPSEAPGSRRRRQRNLR